MTDGVFGSFVYVTFKSWVFVRLCQCILGTHAAIQIYVLHHNPLVWKDPEVSKVLLFYKSCDSILYYQKFDPLRFTVENTKEMDPFAYLPFAAGPRYNGI